MDQLLKSPRKTQHQNGPGDPGKKATWKPNSTDHTGIAKRITEDACESELTSQMKQKLQDTATTARIGTPKTGTISSTSRMKPRKEPRNREIEKIDS